MKSYLQKKIEAEGCDALDLAAAMLKYQVGDMGPEIDAVLPLLSPVETTDAVPVLTAAASAAIPVFLTAAASAAIPVFLTAGQKPCLQSPRCEKGRQREGAGILLSQEEKAQLSQ